MEGAKQLGLSARTIYTLIRRYREGGGSLVTLVPAHSSGGRGGKRLPKQVELIMSSTISEFYLTRRRTKIETVVRDVRRRCKDAKLRVPSANTVRSRIKHLRPEVVIRKREGIEAVRQLGAFPGQFPAVEKPLGLILQAVDDPSLVVPAEWAWKAKGHKASVLDRENFNAREYLLSALGQACGICPNIEASLKGAAPAGYHLDANGAYEFLTQRAWALEQAGFGVLLPAWWTRKGTKLKLAARAVVKSPRMQANAGISLDAVVQFNWEVALGGEPLTFKELQELARLKSPLVRVRGQWVELDPEEIQEALDFWKELALAGIRDMDGANRYIREVYLPTFNAEFMQPAMEEGSAFVAYIGTDLDDILCEQHERVVGKDNCVSFEGLKLQIPPDQYRLHYVKVTVKVHSYPDGNMAVFHGPRRLARYDLRADLKETGEVEKRITSSVGS